MYKFFILFFILIVSSSHAQVINTAYTYRDINGSRYFRYQYENDFFTATDELYTQGINLEYTSPKQKNFLTGRLLISHSNYSSTYKVGLQHNGYTPQSIQDPNIRLNDRPYAAVFMLQFSNTALHSAKKIRISSSISAGVLGHIAGGEWMQKTIHRNLDNVAPQGWQHQIANDIVLNYRLQIENSIISIGNYLLLNTTAGIDAGTLLNRISAGGNLSLGIFHSPYQNKESSYSVNVRVYTHPQIHAIGYDATLQGGFFSQSPHTFTGNEIERFVFDNRYGVSLQIHKLYLEYYYQTRSKNFKQGKTHAWGGLVIGLVF